MGWGNAASCSTCDSATSLWAVTDAVRVDLGAADLACSLLDPICELYDEVFSVPPFFWREDESDLHRERLLRLVEDPTFGIAVAWAGDELVGFAYGFTVPPDTKRWANLTGPTPPELTEEWPGRTFLLFDFAVRRSYRGRGIGRRLHDALLGSRSEERASLSVEPPAADTKAIYEHWGWRKVAQSIGGATAAAPVFDVYVRDSLDEVRAQARP
jgi:GNAT superfamily N-acetyltransferase